MSLSHYLWKGKVSCVMFYRLADLQMIAAEAFDETVPERWARGCEHVEKVVAHYKANDNFIDEQMEETFVINLADDSVPDSSDTDIALP